MANTPTRRLPVGIQSFKEIREEGYLYVDKSDIVWQMVNNGYKYNYLSRPRRFGKSVLVDTLQSYLEGRKELFEGLKIISLEKDWNCYPVIRFDMSQAGAEARTLCSYLNKSFMEYEKLYAIEVNSCDSLAVRLDAIIKAANRTTGMKVAVLIDEYDSPLQHSWRTPEHEACTNIYREVFTILKSDDVYEKFVFITGITKFTQISLFSALNNLTNISFLPAYAPLCGITEEELSSNFQPELERMATINGWTLEETHARLKAYYDGYHFSEDNMVDIYNPFSLINALDQSKIRNFWASSGATTFLFKFVDDMELHMLDLDQCDVMRDTLESSDVAGGGAQLFLYQSGYLTIKHSDEFGYVIGFPNEEVRQALYNLVLPALTLRAKSETESLQAALNRYLGTGKLPEAMKTLKSLIADVPYSNKKLASMDMEERYRLIISTILNAIGLQVEVEHMLSQGRIDILAKTSRYIYVMELKLSNNGGVKAAAQQIAHNLYALPFTADKREVIALALELDDKGRGLINWGKVEQ